MLPYCTVAQAQRIARENGGGKIWHTLNLTQQEAADIEDNGQAVIKLSAPYNPATFTSDYLQVNINIVGEYIGKVIGTYEPLNKVFVDFVHSSDWCNSSVQQAFVDITNPDGGYGIVQENYHLGYIYSQTNAAARSHCKLNSETLEELWEECIGKGFVTADSITGTWQSGSTCPIVDPKIQDSFEDGDIWVGYNNEKTFIVAYRLGSTYYWSACTAKEATHNTVKLYGDNIEMWSKNGVVEEVYTFTPNYVSTNALNGYNMVYIADVTAQPWDKIESSADVVEADVAVAVDELKAGIEVKPGELETSEWGKQFALNIHGKDTKVSYLVVFEDNRMSVIDAQHKVSAWTDTEAGKVYHLTWDATARRYSLGAELTAAEKQTLFATGIVFDAAAGAELVITNDEDNSIYWECEVSGAYYPALQYMFSCDDPFEEPTTEQKMTFIGRPTGFGRQTVRYQDEETGKYVESVDGEYMWEADIGYGSIVAAIPLDHLDTLIISTSASGKSSGTTLYRHTFLVERNAGTSTDCHLSFLAVNGQSGKGSNSIVEYLLWSDTSEGWLLPATGYVQVNSTWYPVVQVGTAEVNNEWSFIAKYLDPSSSYDLRSVVVFDKSTIDNYIGTDTESVVSL